jgi:hypothetical protein
MSAAAGEKALQRFHDWCASEGVAFDREVRGTDKRKTWVFWFGLNSQQVYRLFDADALLPSFTRRL